LWSVAVAAALLIELSVVIVVTVFAVFISAADRATRFPLTNEACMGVQASFVRQ
jgi:hypothetical protein